MKRFGKVLLAALPVLLLSSVASGATLIVSCSSVSGPTELVSAAISCGQFGLGPGFVLSNIDIAVSGGISGSITLTNGDSSPHGTNSGTTSTNFNFAGLSGFTFVNPIFSASFTTGNQPLAAFQTLTVSGLASTPISTGSLGGDNSVFAPYTGGGFFDIFVSTDTLFSSAGGGGAFSSAQDSNANATATVTYTYNAVAAVPEPATLSLVGLGLLGFGFMTRRRQKR